MTHDLFTSPPPLIAIIGRPNVGKSTLFNRILSARNAIVDDVPGVTRDRNYADTVYRGHVFRLVDTGGLDPSSDEGMLPLIRRQTQIAIAEADILIVVMDGRTGLTPADQEIVNLLRGIDKPVFYAINKIDTPRVESLLADFYQIGDASLYPVSAEHGIGVDDLLEACIRVLPASDSDASDARNHPRIAVVGRPNVGKSTLVNTLLGEERVLVSDVPGTTRDPIDTAVTYQDREYVFTDTAGIRRRGRVDEGLEGFSVSRALTAMGRSDVAILVLDAVEGITEQDTKIAGLILKQGRGCIVLVNKWDCRAGDPTAHVEYTRELRRRFRFLPWAPILFGSAMKPDTVTALFPEIDRVMAAFTRRVPTGALNAFVQGLLADNPLPIRKGKPSKATKSVFITQVATSPPTFAFFVARPQEVPKPYVRHLEKRIRERYEFPGCPIRILLRQK